MTNHEPVYRVSSLSPFQRQTLPWAAKAFDEGTLYCINWYQCEIFLQGIWDYFSHLLNNRRRFDRISVPDAIAQSEAWHNSW